MRTAFFLAAAACLAATAPCRADLVVGYAADGNPAFITPTNGNVDVFGDNLVRGPGLTNPGGASDFLTTNWTNESTDYIEFGFSTSDGFDVILSSLEFRTSRSEVPSFPGPPFLDVRVSIDGGAFQSIQVVSVFPAPTNQFVDLSTLPVASTATFRIFGAGASLADGVLRFEDDGNFVGSADVVINGALTVVPEASSFLFGGVIAGAMGLGRVLRSRRRRATQA
jgi:hypothetical protein